MMSFIINSLKERIIFPFFFIGECCIAFASVHALQNTVLFTHRVVYVPEQQVNEKYKNY